MKAVSLFSGCGGFCEGVRAAGVDVVAAVELDRFAAETYRANFPETPLHEGDVASFLSDSKTANLFLAEHPEIDFVFGGPPCQGFSQIGPRNLEDERNQLYTEFGRIVSALRPRFFLMENVPNLVLMQKGFFKNKILKYFRKIGYADTSVLHVSAADFGVPQARNRVFFVGIRDGLNSSAAFGKLVSEHLKAQMVKQPTTVWQALSDLPPDVAQSGEVMSYPSCRNPSAFQREMRLRLNGDIYSAEYKKLALGAAQFGLHNHHTKEIQKRRQHLISLLEPGKKGDSLPAHVWNGKRPEKWRRLHPDLPSYTILAQMHRDLSEWVHPKEERWITVREAARLQSFHDGFVFYGSEWQQLKQVGNAVPPLLARAMAVAASKAASQFVDGEPIQFHDDLFEAYEVAAE